MLRLWHFDKAPARYQGLSQHGGDEDWVAHVPASDAGYYLPFLEDGNGGWFGCAHVSEHPQPDGSTVYIGAHS